MDTNEIVRALRCCANKAENLEGCYTGQPDCPYGETIIDCTERLNRDAADLIESLQAQLAEKTEEAEKWHILRMDADRIREGLMDKEARLISENMRLESQLAESQRREKAAKVDEPPCAGCYSSLSAFEWRGPEEGEGE